MSEFENEIIDIIHSNSTSYPLKLHLISLLRAGLFSDKVVLNYTEIKQVICKYAAESSIIEIKKKFKSLDSLIDKLVLEGYFYKVSSPHTHVSVLKTKIIYKTSHKIFSIRESKSISDELIKKYDL